MTASRLIGVLLLIVGHWLTLVPVLAAESATGPHIKVSLLSEHQAWLPGQRQWIGIYLQPDPDWHTYWRNPGDSGESPAVTWSSSAPLQTGDIHWPLPTAIPVAHLVNYGYEGDTLLIVPIDVPEQAQGSISLSGDLSWLVCKEDCIPGWATLTISLPVRGATQVSEHAHLFDTARAQLPQPEPLAASFEQTDSHLVFAFPSLAGEDWRLFPFAGDAIDHAGQQAVMSSDQGVLISVPRSAYFTDRERLSVLIANQQTGYYADVQLNLSAAASGAPAVASLWWLLLSAFLGGLLLNIMPCVLPVLSMKAMALQHHSPSWINKSAYLLGVLASFNAFAGLVILLRASGQSVGWGFHMQEPMVVALLAFLFVFIAMVLLDAFALGTRLSGLGQSLVGGQSTRSHFFTGVLAVVVASPCTAPFMAAAMGVAMVAPNMTTFALFTALALGFALPMTLLFVSSKTATWLPKPGPWMQTFKHLLAFGMLLTVAWLCWVYVGQAGAIAQFGLMVALIVFAMLLWLASRASMPWRALLQILAIACVISPSWFEKQNSPSQPLSVHAIAFDPSELNTLRAENQVVLVNMTADWCITCKVNEQVALSDASVVAALDDPEVTYMVGDWTNKNPQILAYLNQYARSGVPLYVIYSGQGHARVLPQILTPDIVINGIEQAKQERNNET